LDRVSIQDESNIIGLMQWYLTHLRDRVKEKRGILRVFSDEAWFAQTIRARPSTDRIRTYVGDRIPQEKESPSDE